MNRVGFMTAPGAVEQLLLDAKPLPKRGNFIGWLPILLKAQWEMSDLQPENAEAILAEFNQMETMGQARALFERVMPLIQQSRPPVAGS
jgi:hypothetical protein